jgi:hypothetical protein
MASLYSEPLTLSQQFFLLSSSSNQPLTLGDHRMQHVKAIPNSEKEKEVLKAHIFGTYVTLRMGMGILSAVFPLLLYIVGEFHGINLQGTMSAYYWAGADGAVAPRTIFVGCLLAISVFFYLYKGFTVSENIALNFAAVFGILVALFPMSWNCSPEKLPPIDVVYCPSTWNPHGTSAIALFTCLAYVSWFCAQGTLSALNNPTLERRYSLIYKITGVLMFISPITAAVMQVVFNQFNSYTYFIELFGIMAFAVYWIAKSLELSQTRLVEDVLGVKQKI